MGPTEPLDPGPKLPQEMAEFSATLNTGAKMPRVGLGTWKAPPEKTWEAVMTAVKAGYRMLDCANDYDNEHVIGEALKELFAAGVVKREELFIQAKLWNSNHRPEHVRPDIMKTLEDLQLDYIGLSNFNKRQVEGILLNAKKHKPAVLQNESHPYLHEKDLRDYCRLHGIAFQAYSALGSADRPWALQGSITSEVPKTGHEVLKHPEIAKIASKHGKSTANVVIRWHLQMGGTLCTKSVTPSRIQENFNVWDFKLTDEDMAVMDSLNVGWRHLLWAETSMHPDYPFKDCLPWDYKLQKPGVGATAGAK